MDEPLLVSKRSAAAMLGVSVRTLENLIAVKEIPVRRIGRRRLLERQALEKFARRDHSTRPKVRPFDPHGQWSEESSTNQQTKVAP